jgi:hypothetical protein
MDLPRTEISDSLSIAEFLFGNDEISAASLEALEFQLERMLHLVKECKKVRVTSILI